MNFRHFILFFAAAFACLYLAFSATVIVPYVNHDSVRYFHKVFNKKDPRVNFDPQYRWVHSCGRPLAAELEQFLYKKIEHLSDLSFARLVSVAAFALSAALLACMGVSLGIDLIAAFALSVAIFTLPGVQESVFVPYLFNTLPIFGSIVAYAVWSSRLIFGMRLVLTFILLEAAFFTYPSSAFFFLIPTAITAVYSAQDEQGLRKIWVRDVLMWIVCAALFYGFLKIYYYKKLILTNHEIAFPLEHVFNYIKSFPTLVPRLFNLWNVYNSQMAGILLAGLAGACVIGDILLVKRTWRAQRLLAVLIIFLIFNGVWFMFGGYQPRVFIASQAMALIVVFWCAGWLVALLTKNGPLAKAWPVLIMLTGLIWANQTVTPNVWNNSEELMFIRDRISRSVDENTRYLYIIPKRGVTGYNGLPTVYDNLNGSTVAYEVPDMVRAAVRDIPEKPFQKLEIIGLKEGETYPVLPGTVVIDMNDLLNVSTLREANLKIRAEDQ